MRSVQLYGLTCPLLTKSDGTKMGKTEQGAVWLDADRTSPYQFYQYLINVDDADVGPCLRMLTELPREEIEAARRGSRARTPSARDSQTLPGRGADPVGPRRSGPGGRPAGHRDLLRRRNRRSGRRPTRRRSLPTCRARRWPETCCATTAACRSSTRWWPPALAKSKGEARRTVEQGGAYVNNRRVAGVDARLTERRPGQRIGHGAANRQEEVRLAAVRVGHSG